MSATVTAVTLDRLSDWPAAAAITHRRHLARADQLTIAITRLQVYAPGLTSPNRPYDQEGQIQGPRNPAYSRDNRATRKRPNAENSNQPQPQPYTPRSGNIKANRLCRSTARQ